MDREEQIVTEIIIKEKDNNISFDEIHNVLYEAHKINIQNRNGYAYSKFNW